MNNKLVVASVATHSCLKEFLLTKYSCELFNECIWYVGCDQYSYNYLKKYNNIQAIQYDMKDNQSDHNSNNKENREQFLKIILNKFNILEVALKENSYCLFLDSDMLFLDKIDNNIINLIKNTPVDFIVSPHYSRDPMNEDKHGFYNVGMFALKDPSHIKQWRYLSENCEKFGLYYEQKPFELILSNFNTLNLPINYNIGWWRFNNQRTQSRLSQLSLANEQVMFGDLPAINFHFHVFKSPDGYNPGQFLVDKVMKLLNLSHKIEYKKILEYYEKLSETSF